MERTIFLHLNGKAWKKVFVSNNMFCFAIPWFYEVHFRIYITYFVSRKVVSLYKLIVDWGQGCVLRKLIAQVLVHQIVVVVELSVDVRAVLHEVRLGVLVGHVEWVRAIVEVHIPVNADVVGSWYVFPICFVCLWQLRALFCLVPDDSVHGKWSKCASDRKDDACNKKADSTAFELLQFLPLGFRILLS